MGSIIIPIIIGLALAGGVAYVIIKNRKDDGSAQGTVSAPPASGWIQQFGNVAVDAATGNFQFGEPHYIVRAPGPLAIGQTVSIKFRLDGTGTLVPLQGTNPTLSFYFQRVGDDMSGAGAFQQYRYFAVGPVLGAASNYEFSIQLNPENWGDVFGARGSDYPAQFTAAVANASAIGFVFGDPGAGATGHGVKANGPVSFTLLEFSIA